MWNHKPHCDCPVCYSLPRIFQLIGTGTGLPDYPAYVSVLGSHLRHLEGELRDEVARRFPGVGLFNETRVAPPAQGPTGETKEVSQANPPSKGPSQPLQLATKVPPPVPPPQLTAQEVARTSQIDEDPETVTEVQKQLRRKKSLPHHPEEGPEAEKEGEVLEPKTKEGEYTGLPALELPPKGKEARIEIESGEGAPHHVKRSRKEARRESDTLRSHQSRLFPLLIEEEQITGVHVHPITHRLLDKVVVGSANCLCPRIPGGRPPRTKDK